ncbi:hypothetical protein EST38_g12737 [Candolleomyces aberdarensis]|uniref:Uncharacterized protein n=1 Tax=Candolleomyces aberdarensis TaxID=2316362 RepID=A0A4V1Q1X6_9AGAR|nr:hypothetical protein EST38_g12737 [Candolleomyces aberdarensis]
MLQGSSRMPFLINLKEIFPRCYDEVETAEETASPLIDYTRSFFLGTGGSTKPVPERKRRKRNSKSSKSSPPNSGSEQQQPVVSQEQSTVPQEQPVKPQEQPAVPQEQSAVPREQPAVPQEQPAVPQQQSASNERQNDGSQGEKPLGNLLDEDIFGGSEIPKTSSDYPSAVLPPAELLIGTTKSGKRKRGKQGDPFIFEEGLFTGRNYFGKEHAESFPGATNKAVTEAWSAIDAKAKAAFDTKAKAAKAAQKATTTTAA